LYSTVGDIVIELTYGKKVRVALGKDFSTWNLEAVDLINDAFLKFWFVDIFKFC